MFILDLSPEGVITEHGNCKCSTWVLNEWWKEKRSVHSPLRPAWIPPYVDVELRRHWWRAAARLCLLWSLWQPHGLRMSGTAWISGWGEQWETTSFDLFIVCWKCLGMDELDAFLFEPLLYSIDSLIINELYVVINNYSWGNVDNERLCIYEVNAWITIPLL